MNHFYEKYYPLYRETKRGFLREEDVAAPSSASPNVSLLYSE